MKKKVYIIIITLFIAACALPFAGMYLFGESEAASNEILSDSPALLDGDGAFNAELASEYSDYVSDRFFLRQELITLWSRLNASVFKTSASEKVILGKDGWLFYSETLNDYLGKDLMTERELYCAARGLYLMSEYAEGEGTRLLFVTAPNKSSLYPEQMADYVKFSENSNFAALASALDGLGVEYADLFSTFEAAGETLYFKWDTHWNGRGAALAADSVLALAGRSAAFYAGGFSEKNDHAGDLYEMLYPAGRETETDYEPVPGFSFEYDIPIRSADNLTIMTSNEVAEGSCLCFRDSFGNSLYPYLAESFESAYFSRMSEYDLTLVSQRRADIVIIELAERNLSRLAENAAVFPAPEREPVSARKETLPVSVKVSDAGKYVRVDGSFDWDIDADSPIYLVSGEKTYESTPLAVNFGNSFTAYLDKSAEMSIIIKCNGEFISADLYPEN